MEEMKADVNTVYAPSDDVVAREIEQELIIVPLAAGIGDMEDELYTLNEVGKVVWNRLDGQKTLKAIVDELAGEYDAKTEEIEKDVIGFVEELLKRKMLYAV